MTESTEPTESLRVTKTTIIMISDGKKLDVKTEFEPEFDASKQPSFDQSAAAIALNAVLQWIESMKDKEDAR